LVFHATPETCAANADAEIGPCVAQATSASFSGRSIPKLLEGVGRQREKALVVDAG
jgi:hypothetical protein